MSPTSPSLPSSDSRLKWRKRKRDASNSLKRQKNHEDEDDDEDEDDEAEEEEDNTNNNNQDSPANNHPNADPIFDLRESEVLSDIGQRISDFPVAVKRYVNRPHPSVIGLVVAEKFATVRSLPLLENLSHGQLQALSSVPGDNSLLNPAVDQDKATAYVCTPPVLMEGKGVEKRFGDGKIHLVPMHSDWFSPTTVHRLERQVVPHYFSGKSAEHTPEKYMALRNKIVSKYLENPERRLAFGDCQGLVSSSEHYDLSRIVRFLDNWGIINYVSASSRVFRMAGSLMAGSLIKEDINGELNVHTSHLRSIDSLILFDKLKCSVRLEDIGLLASSTADGTRDADGRSPDLDTRIRERFSEHACSYCSCPLPQLHYQSQKEADTILCSDCFHDAKFIIGHSSIDFVRVDSRKETFDPDGDSWTDQETLLLLEALEKYKENWNEIAEYVGTKSKAQCILHFLRLPMEDGLLESIEVMPIDGTSNSKGHDHGSSYLNTNGDTTGVSPHEADHEKIPFANAANPVMSLVAFLSSAIGPRVAASCASASLAVLTKGDPRPGSDKIHNEVGSQVANAKNLEDQIPYTKRDVTSPLAPDCMKFAAMCGLSAAATKAKLFADQEEREVQRLAATIINHQLKRLELKLKQFAEVETLLMKECEQVEKTRQRLSTERVRMMTNRFGQGAGTTIPAAAAGPQPPPVAGAAMNTMNTNTRPPTMPASVGQANVLPATFGNNIPPNNHPHLQFMQRQQMYGFGPRLPLSAINPSSSAPSQNMMFNSGIPNTSAPNHHPLLRSSSGNNSNAG